MLTFDLHMITDVIKLVKNINIKNKFNAGLHGIEHDPKMLFI